MKKIIVLISLCGWGMQAADIKSDKVVMTQDAVRSKLNNKLIKAADSNNSERINQLVKGGAQVQFVNHEDLTPLHVAAKKGNKEAVIELLKAKANVNAKNMDGITPLHEAAAGDKNEFGGAYVIPTLVEAGANVTAQDKLYRTPFQVAVQNKYLDGVHALIVSVSPDEIKLGLPKIIEKKIELARKYLPMQQEEQIKEEAKLKKEIETSFKRVQKNK